ncbi:MAG: helix-turn-helix domain-containing protein [Treponema sp.]|jgi:predicted transcriptional regulator YheO|nr:helix-turn-helix domain-containing protein [Treponema sp.]
MGKTEKNSGGLISEYLPVMKFLSMVYDMDTEIVLTNMEKIIHVENPLNIHTRPGAPLGEREKFFFRDRSYHNKEYIINYRALSANGDRLRSSTMFIRDDDGKLIGSLTISTRVEELLRMRNVVDLLINGAHSNFNINEPKDKSPPVYENLSISVEDMVAETVNKGLAHSGVPVERLTPKEKKTIVHELDQKGIFMVKGAISIVAKRLSSSDATIYRYLQQLGEV